MGEEIFMQLEKMAGVFIDKNRLTDAKKVIEVMEKIDKAIKEGTDPVTPEVLEDVRGFVAVLGDIQA